MSIYNQMNIPQMHTQTDTNQQMGYASTVGGGAMTMAIRRKEPAAAAPLPVTATALLPQTPPAKSALVQRRAA